MSVSINLDIRSQSPWWDLKDGCHDYNEYSFIREGVAYGMMPSTDNPKFDIGLLLLLMHSGVSQCQILDLPQRPPIQYRLDQIPASSPKDRQSKLHDFQYPNTACLDPVRPPVTHL
jgi:hypothetical protein